MSSIDSVCSFSDLPTPQCAHCRGVVIEDPPPPRHGHPFRAKFAGRCRQEGCSETIEEGDLIRFIGERVACRWCS